jgi:hypothetical protein
MLISENGAGIMENVGLQEEIEPLRGCLKKSEKIEETEKSKS